MKKNEFQNQIIYLKIENEILKKHGNFFAFSNKEKTKIVEEFKSKFPISHLLKILNLKKSTYYKCKIAIKNNIDKDFFIKNIILGEYLKSGKTYGYRRITYSIKNMGININHKKVYRLMKQMQIKSISKIQSQKYNTCFKNRNSSFENLLNQNFTASKPYTKWVTDITEFKISGRKIYFSPILDLYNQEIISYTIFEKPEIFSVIQMLDEACKKVSAKNIILHTDNGWQYKTFLFRKIAQHHGIIQSMSRPGKCHDNAVIENFFGTVKKEFVYNKNISIKEFKQKLSEYIFYYNTKRIKNKFKMSPIEYKNMDYKKAKIKLCALS
ncbi:MAG: IS3 family transposase [Treponema sp.]|nr:IS3 family transposase [Treponema sp.]